jgi:Retrotransposon gag protein
VLEVVRASIEAYKGNLTYVVVWTEFEASFKNPVEGERALLKLQQLIQKREVETYIQEFNTLQGLAADVATLDSRATLRYFIQGLQRDIRIGVAASVLVDVDVAQQTARAMEVALQGK